MSEMNQALEFDLRQSEHRSGIFEENLVIFNVIHHVILRETIGVTAHFIDLASVNVKLVSGIPPLIE